MNLLLLNAASGSKLEQALEKLVDFGMDAGKDIFVCHSDIFSRSFYH